MSEFACTLNSDFSPHSDYLSSWVNGIAVWVLVWVAMFVLGHLQCSYLFCFNNKIINNLLEPFSSWAIKQEWKKFYRENIYRSWFQGFKLWLWLFYFGKLQFVLFPPLRGHQCWNWWFTWAMLICLLFCIQ